VEKDFPRKCPPKMGRRAIVISNKADFRPELVRRDKGHFILMNVISKRK
jgi:hypothetical protein